MAVVQAGEDRVAGERRRSSAPAARGSASSSSTGPTARIWSPSTSTEPGSNATAPPVMGRTIPLRRSVGIRATMQRLQQTVNVSRPVFTQRVTRTSARIAWRSVARSGKGGPWNWKVHASWWWARRRASVVRSRCSSGPAVPESSWRRGGPTGWPRRSPPSMVAPGTARPAWCATCAIPRSATRSWRRRSKQLGGLDAVVYATAVDPLVRLVDTDLERWRQVYETNVFGASLVTRAVLGAAHRVGRSHGLHLGDVGGAAAAGHGRVRDEQGRARRAGAGVAERAPGDRVLQRRRRQHPRHRGARDVGPRPARWSWPRCGKRAGYVYDNGPGRCRSPTARLR